MTDPLEMAQRRIQFASEAATVAAEGLLEMFLTEPAQPPSLLEEYGYEWGLLCYLGSGITWMAACFVATTPLIVIGAALLIAAFVLCWTYG